MRARTRKKSFCLFLQAKLTAGFRTASNPKSPDNIPIADAKASPTKRKPPK